MALSYRMSGGPAARAGLAKLGTYTLRSRVGSLKPGLASAVCLGLAAAGCASIRPIGLAPPPAAAPPAAPPPPTAQELLAAEFAWSTHLGTNTLIGDVAYRSDGGRSWTCAGQSVALAPDTPTSRAHVQALYGSVESAVQPVAVVRARNAAAPGADFSAWVRTTTCSAGSGFAFRNLPEGGFYIIARARPRGREATAAAALVMLQRVRVRGGSVQQVVVPQPLR